MMPRMISWLPFAEVDRRTAWLRGTLLVACFLGMIASAPVWLSARGFPLLPITSWFPILPPPWDKCFFGSLLLALVLAGWCYRAAVIYFLSASMFAFCQDQNRGQPWFYMYWVLLLLTLLPPPTALAACRWALTVVYLWSGIQKCNTRFFQVMPAWFVSPAEKWHLPAATIDVFRWTVAATPVLEVAIGLALWSSRWRRPAIVAAVGLHLGAVLFLGPLGHNYNWVVWPWNLAMISLVGALFLTGSVKPNRPAPAVARWPSAKNSRHEKQKISSQPGPDATPAGPCLTETFTMIRRSRLALAVLIPFSLLPILSYCGWWDSNFSFALYSENKATANIFVTKALGNRLPPVMCRHVHPFPPVHDPQHQAPYYFAFEAWGYEAMHVPPLSEPRNFRAIFHHLRAYSKETEDLRMIIGAREGSVMFYQGESASPLTAK